jgi:signal transduction histidine kinase
MKNRLFQKIFLSTALSLIVTIILTIVLLSVTVNGYFVKEKENLLTDNCRTIASVLTNQTDDTTGFYISLNGVMKVVSNAVSGDSYVCDAEGNIFLCSCREWQRDNTCIHSHGMIDSTLLSLAKDGSYFEVGKLKSHYKNTYYTACTPFYSSDGLIAGYVFISSPASLLESMWSELSSIFIFCASIPVLIMFVILYFLTKRIIKPVKLMSEAAVNMSNGDFSKRIPVSGDDEISELAEAFNSMSNSLTQLESMRRSFIANVSHELRTPMTTIGGFIDGILDGTIPCEKQEYYLTIVSSEIERLSRLVQSMLSLAKLESGEQKTNISKFCVVDLIGDVLISQEQRITEKNIEIEGLDLGTDIKLNADRDLIYQAVFNLTDNAIKFTPENGVISYNISVDEIGSVSVKIRNTGEGIKPEDLQYIFDRFYKTDKSRSENKEGTGLGLYIVKTIVDIHGGHITVSSKQGLFTEFAITLPSKETK